MQSFRWHTVFCNASELAAARPTGSQHSVLYACNNMQNQPRTARSWQEAGSGYLMQEGNVQVQHGAAAAAPSLEDS